MGHIGLGQDCRRRLPLDRPDIRFCTTSSRPMASLGVSSAVLRVPTTRSPIPYLLSAWQFRCRQSPGPRAILTTCCCMTLTPRICPPMEIFLVWSNVRDPQLPDLCPPNPSLSAPFSSRRPLLLGADSEILHAILGVSERATEDHLSCSLQCVEQHLVLLPRYLARESASTSRLTNYIWLRRLI